MGKYIIKYRYALLVLFLAIVILAGCMFPTMINKVNYDLTSYLPEGYATYDGFQFLSKHFNIHGDIEIGINATYSEAKEVAELITNKDGVTGCTWAGMLGFIPDISAPGTGYDENEDTIKIQIGDSKLFNETWATMTDIPYDSFKNLSSKTPTIEDTTKYNWALLVTLKYPPSNLESIQIFRTIKSDILNPIVGKDGYSSSGMTDQATALFDTVFDEITNYAIVSGIVVLIILLLTTNSLTEPLILIITMVASIIMNLGTNAFFPSTSIITFACSAILQLGLSMDYAIFLLHQYRYELTLTIDPKQALANAIPKSAKAIFASALTTVCGLLSLLVMKFGVGADLGLVIAKGILCSFLTVLFLQPCLMLLCEKGRTKTQHKCLDFKYKQPIKRSVRDKKWVGIVFAALLIPVAFGAQTLQYAYIKFLPPSGDTSAKAQMAQKLGNQVVIVAPIDTKGDSNYTFFERIENDFTNEISYKLGLHIMFPEFITDSNGDYLKNDGTIVKKEDYYKVMFPDYKVNEDGDFITEDGTLITQEEYNEYKVQFKNNLQKNYLNLPLKGIWTSVEPVIDQFLDKIEAGDEHAINFIKNMVNNIAPDLSAIINIYINGIQNHDGTSKAFVKDTIKSAFIDKNTNKSTQYTITNFISLIPVLDKLKVDVNDLLDTAYNFIIKADSTEQEKADFNTVKEFIINHYTVNGELQKASPIDMFYLLISDKAQEAKLPVPKELSMVGSFVARVEDPNNPGSYNYYTMYTAGINDAIDNESKQSFAILDKLYLIAEDCFGKGNFYVTGLTQTAYDFAKITPNDFMWVSIISVLAIFLILILTLRSIKFPILLVLVIESGIWINLLLQYIFAAGTINFMSYLFISAVQLGATVDYAILVATKYKENRKRFEPNQAAYLAATSSAMSITTSALIMAGACMSVYAIATNLIIKEMTFLMSRGCIISAALVIFVLPALLPLIDRNNGHEIHFTITPKIRKWRRKIHEPKNTKAIGKFGEITPDKQEFTGAEISYMMSNGIDIENTSNKDMHKWLKKNF